MPVFGVIGDIHEHEVYLAQVVDWLGKRTLDGVLVAGDIAEGLGCRHEPDPVAAWRERVDEVLAPVRGLGVPVAWVPGNHDMCSQGEPGNADRTMIAIAGVRVVGIGGAGPATFGFPYEWGEDEIRELDLPSGDVLLSHAPPAGILDRTRFGESVGSEAVFERAAVWRGALVCGHIHEAAGAKPVGQCLCYNAGALGEPCGAPQVGLLTIDAARAHVRHMRLDDRHEWEAELRFA